ncbi:MAG TPA: FtsQ-type POTRA domain-containing protein [Acidimicrobiales bacterium]
MTTTATTPRPAPPRMDPRMRARRVAVRRDEGRRRLRRLLVMAAVAGVAAAGYLLTRSPLLDVDHLRVHGAERTGTEAVLTAAGISRGDPMTDVSLDGAHDAIAELPWVESVRVERDWPGTIEIHVTERVPVAALRTGAGVWVLLDGTGHVLTTLEGAPPDLPVIAVDAAATSPGAQQHGLAGALAVARLLTPDLRAWLDSIQPAPDGTVELLLHDGIRVKLGSEAHLWDKLVDLATVLTRVDLTDIETIDVSVVHDPIVTRRAA